LPLELGPRRTVPGPFLPPGNWWPARMTSLCFVTGDPGPPLGSPPNWGSKRPFEGSLLSKAHLMNCYTFFWTRPKSPLFWPG
jgi:hypothetical protein